MILACCLPLHHLHLTSGFGYRIHPITGKWAYHSGIDLSARADTVFCILDGVVRQSGYDQKLGLYIRIDHGSGVTSTYGHLSQSWVMKADTLTESQPIGITGATGQVTGEHLHFSIAFGQHYLNPLLFLRQLLKPIQTPKEP
ncbi:Peptidase family M23 [Mucilaginibacter pineti]|uniref:Peptidase family M23 n=2 Tax=Mucilaginibacter pineti TaxID=1391627 RepID=A0A1G7N675_9SPHI|nr:Peptidase family M23 [Mucilaginibacter pineti]